MLREDLEGEHPTSDLLERFMQNRMEPSERRTIVRHLIQGCPTCVVMTREIWALGDPFDPFPAAQAGAAGDPDAWEDLDSPAGPFFPSPDYSGKYSGGYSGEPSGDSAGSPPGGPPDGNTGPLPEPLERVERTEAGELLAALDAFPRPDRLIQVRADRRYRTRGFCLRLTEGSRATADPLAAVESGELAVAVSERLDPRVYGTPGVHSAQIQAWAWYGEARRRAGDLEGAERSLAMAAFLLEGGLEDLRQGAEVLRLQAAVQADLGRRDEAHRLLGQALAVYESLRDDRLRGRVLMQKGEVCRVAGEDAAAIDLFQEGTGLLAETDPALEPEDRDALATALFHLLSLQVEAGRGEEAAAAAVRLRPLWEEAGNRAGLARLRRLEGRAEELAGGQTAAEAAYWEARQACLDEQLGIEAALAIFDLAVLFLRQARLDDFQRLAPEVYPHYKARGIGPGETSALSVLRQQCENREPRLDLLVEVGRYIASALRPRRALKRQDPASRAAAG